MKQSIFNYAIFILKQIHTSVATKLLNVDKASSGSQEHIGIIGNVMFAIAKMNLNLLLMRTLQ